MKHHIKEDEESDKEKAKMLQEFWLRKNEAAANKARASEALVGPSQVNYFESKRTLYYE